MLERAVFYLDQCDMLYISFDVDSMDPDEISYGTGTPVKNGFGAKDVQQIINRFIKTQKLICFEVVEINPTLDNKCNRMAEVADFGREQFHVLFDIHDLT